MGNDIDNNFTIISDNKEQLDNIYDKYFKGLSICKVTLKIHKIIKVKYYSRNEPRIDIVEDILKNYNQVWIKNAWDSEYGHCGIAIGGYKGNIYYPIKVFEWEELDIDERCHYYL